MARALAQPSGMGAPLVDHRPQLFQRRDHVGFLGRQFQRFAGIAVGMVERGELSGIGADEGGQGPMC